MSDGSLSHMVGDYVVQSGWMAHEKTSRSLPAALHALSYGACFLPVTRNTKALAVIAGTHFVIDRWRLARHVVWAKNQVAPEEFRYPWEGNKATGYPAEEPPWLSTWLMIIADNIIHMAINKWALKRWVR